MAASSLEQPAGAERGESFRHVLRDATRVDHELVDAKFARFDLADAASYRRFLTAHAMVLPALEAGLAPAELIEAWRGRTAPLRRDLAALGAEMPVSRWTGQSIEGAARWGALYVLEGSRLGGIFLARRVGAGLPVDYLSAGHPPGAWKSFLARLDAATRGPEWSEAAVTSAKRVFATYADAADCASADD